MTWKERKVETEKGIGTVITKDVKARGETCTRLTSHTVVQPFQTIQITRIIILKVQLPD